MFDWDEMKIQKPRSAEELYKAAHELAEKKKRENTIDHLPGRPKPVNRTDEH